MVYKVIGVMSGSSLDGLDIVFAELQENGGAWQYEIIKADCFPFTDEWIWRLRSATGVSAREYQLFHAEFGHYIGQKINEFINTHQLQYQVAMIASHGHTTFHLPAKKMTAQLGDGAAIAAVTGLPVVTDLRAMDVAFGGQGAPIVPIGEKLLLPGYDFFLNIGGIANISSHGDPYIAYDVCPANRVLNMLANERDLELDQDGEIARGGKVNTHLLQELNEMDYYKQPYPKSLANEFGTEEVFSTIKRNVLPLADSLRTYVEHIAEQVTTAVTELAATKAPKDSYQLLATGGGAFNKFLMERMQKMFLDAGIDIVIPDGKLVKFKEALIIALIGVLRWREEYTTLPSVTGASRASIGGALWNGHEA